MKTTILRQLIVLPLLTAVMAMLYACGAASGVGRMASTSQPRFTTTVALQQGGSVAISQAATPGLSSAAPSPPVIRLERVNDSRCRTDAVCVWAGYLSYSFTLITPDGASSSFVLSDSMPNGAVSATRAGLTFTLASAEPPQVAAKDEQAADYRVSLRVSNMSPP